MDIQIGENYKMKKTSIITTVYNQYELLRQLIESILTHIDKTRLDRVIICDDYSEKNGKLREYENYLTENYSNLIKVINFDEYRQNVYISRGEYNIQNTDFSKFDSMESNLGPAFAVQKALDEVGEDSDYVLIVDTDTMFLDKSKNLLEEIDNNFQKYEKVMCLGQVINLNLDENFLFERMYDSKISTKRGNRSGEVSPMSYACRMDAWRKYGIKPISVKREVIAWSNTHFVLDIFDKGFHTLNFPLFSSGYIIHLAGCTVNDQVPGRKRDAKYIPFCEDFSGSYGGRVTGGLTDYYSGRYGINMSTELYKKYLQELGNRPFNEIIPFDEKNLIVFELLPQYNYKGIGGVYKKP